MFNETKKKINCFTFIYIKLGESKAIKNTLPDKLGNPESPKK